MTRDMDPRRLDVPADPETAARDSQIEALLVDGLDHYFARRYDEAIHLWTRVLFLDRSHARARAYIERARTALAERQRRAEELLATGHNLIDQGRTGAARDVLAEAVATTGEDERASALRLRLERVERAQVPASGEQHSARLSAPMSAWVRARMRPGMLSLVAASATVALLLVTVPTVQSMMGLPSGRTEVALATAPDRVGLDSSSRSEADQLRIEIQRLLLASGRESSRAPAGSGSHAP
jgi:tetratricopeptide (TPR) repeat protein